MNTKYIFLMISQHHRVCVYVPVCVRACICGEADIRRRERKRHCIEIDEQGNWRHALAPPATRVVLSVDPQRVIINRGMFVVNVGCSFSATRERLPNHLLKA